MPGKKGMKQKPLLQGQIEWAINETKSASAAALNIKGLERGPLKLNYSVILRRCCKC